MMTFYVLLPGPVTPFGPDDLPTVIEWCGDVDGVKPMMLRAQLAHPNDRLFVVESICEVGSAIPRIPPELARAVEAWNLMCVHLRGTKIPQVRAIGNYVGPYRRWKRKNATREYLLEDVIAAVERATWSHHFVKFGWLLGTKDGDLNSDKIIHGNGYGKQRRQNEGGDEFAAEER